MTVKIPRPTDQGIGNKGAMKTVPEEKDLELVYQLAAQGKSLRIIAARLGISYPLLDIWLGNNKLHIDKSQPTVRAAWEGGLAEYEESLSSVLHRNAFNDDSRMQVASAMFLLKAKCKWRENDPPVQVEVKTKAPAKFKVKNITPTESDE